MTIIIWVHLQVIQVCVVLEQVLRKEGEFVDSQITEQQEKAG